MPDKVGASSDAKRYPPRPGCYLMKDADGEVVYVGKAKSLRRRLSSYLRSRHREGKTARLVERIAEVEVILVHNETEGLVLENNLIKLYKPPFNRRLVEDDTGYHYIVLTGEEYPRFVRYRKNRMNKPLEGIEGRVVAKRFGPYISYHYRNLLLEYVTDRFKTRTCKTLPTRVCLRHHLGKCSGVCEHRTTPEAYAAAVDRSAAFLSHRHPALIQRMKDQMAEHAAKLEFEQAQRIRDQVEMLEEVLEQQAVERDVRHDQDVVYFGEHQALVARAEQGIVLGLDLLDLDPALSHSEACDRFLIARYAQDSPGELIVSHSGDRERVAEALTSSNGYEVRITIPRYGVKRELLELCELNYRYRALGAEC